MSHQLLSDIETLLRPAALLLKQDDDEAICFKSCSVDFNVAIATAEQAVFLAEAIASALPSGNRVLVTVERRGKVLRTIKGFSMACLLNGPDQRYYPAVVALFGRFEVQYGLLLDGFEDIAGDMR